MPVKLIPIDCNKESCLILNLEYSPVNKIPYVVVLKGKTIGFETALANSDTMIPSSLDIFESS